MNNSILNLLYRYSCYLLVFISLLMIFTYPLKLESQERKLKFEQGLKGLPSQKEGTMVRDHDGFLWFAYYGGIGRYDGHKVKYYEPGPESISGPAPISISVDQNGIIWILTKDNGLNKYDKNTDAFTHYRHDPNNSNSIASDLSNGFNSQRLFITKSNKLLIATINGLDIYDPVEKSFTHFKHDPQNSNSLSSNDLNAVLEDREGIIWVGTSREGLNRFDPQKNQWTRFKNIANQPNSISGNTVWSLIEDVDGIIWAGTWKNGLNSFNKLTSKFTRYQKNENDPDSIKNNSINYLYEDSSGSIWVTHRGAVAYGLEMFDKKTQKFIHYAPDDKDPFSISSNSVSSVFEDPVTGIFWIINTFEGVFDKFDSKSQKFTLYQPNPNNPNSLFSPQTLVMQEDQKQRFWVSTNGSIEQFDRNTGKFHHNLLKNISPYLTQFVMSFLEDPSGKFWMLSYNGPLTLFDPDEKRVLKHFVHDPANSKSMMMSTSGGGIIIQDRDDPNIIWLGLSGGIDKFNTKTEQFTHFTNDANDPNSITPSTVWSIFDDGKGSLWISAFGGLCRMDKKTEQFTRYLPDPNNPNSIGFKKQSTVFEDSFGNFWVAGFTDGMDKLDRKTGVFKHFNKKTGFSITGINQTIQEDNSGNLWIGTTGSGLIKFNIKKEEIVNQYNKSDGLQDSHFWRSYKTKDGKMWFGGGFGLNSFYPDKIKNNEYIPHIKLTSITQGGQKLNLGIAPERVKTITLDWKANFFEFEFTSLNYTKPEKNQYAYMLEGRDDDWYYAGTNPSGRYTGLSGGKYTLRLKGSNNDGVWNHSGAAIEIIVVPPFWQRWWFYSLLVFWVVLTVFISIYYILRLQKEIQDRRLAQQTLQKSKENYRILVETINEGIAKIDEQGFIIYANPRFCEISGYTFKEMTHLHITDFFDEDNQAILKQQLINREKGSEKSYEIAFLRYDGSKIPTMIFPKALFDKENIYQGSMAVITDITEHKQAEHEIRQLNQGLEKSVAQRTAELKASLATLKETQRELVRSERLVALGNMVAGVAHEINTPVGIGITESSFLKDTTLELQNQFEAETMTRSAFQEYVKLAVSSSTSIFNNLSRAGNLIKSFKQVAVDQTSEVKREFYVKKYLQETLLSLHSQIKKSKHKVIIECSEELMLNSYPGVFSQIVTNFILNSIRHGFDGIEAGKMQLIVSEKQEIVSFRYLDNGHGMAENTVKQIFDPFFTTKRNRGGTGLGLHIVYNLVTHNLKGQISCKSSPGNGTEFLIEIPANNSVV